MKQTENKIINKKHGFTMIENCILRNPKISKNARLLYGVLLSYAFGSDSCFPGQARLAAEMNLSVREVQNLLNELRGWGLISWAVGKAERLDAYGKNYVITNTYTIEKVPGYIKREFDKEQADLLTEIKNTALFGKPTKEDMELKRKGFVELQKRMENKGKAMSLKVGKRGQN